VPQISVRSVDATLAESLEIEAKVTPKIVKDNAGNFSQGQKIQLVNTAHCRFKGDTPSGIVLGAQDSSPITQFASGKTFITEIENTDKNDDFNEGSFTVENYPSAS
jgi:hypothetical protein